MIIFLIGLPGAGKGQLAQMLKEKLQIPAFSMGQVIRDSDHEDLKQRMLRGELLDDEVITTLTFETIEKNYKNTPHIIIDGFPRTVNQAKAIENVPNSIIVSLECDEKILEIRLCNRIMCAKCNTIYNTYYNNVTQCSCGSTEFKKRPDDSVEVFHKRMQTQKPPHLAILNYLKNKIIKLDSSINTETVFQEFVKLLK